MVYSPEQEAALAKIREGVQEFVHASEEKESPGSGSNLLLIDYVFCSVSVDINDGSESATYTSYGTGLPHTNSGLTTVLASWALPDDDLDYDA